MSSEPANQIGTKAVLFVGIVVDDAVLTGCLETSARRNSKGKEVSFRQGDDNLFWDGDVFSNEEFAIEIIDDVELACYLGEFST